MLIVALVATACAAGTVPHAAPVPAGTIPRCDQIPPVEASPAAYRDDPVYVANEMPIAKVETWARGRPGFEAIWIDREHNGWITVAFSTEADRRQAELEREFPGVGVVAVPVDWHVSDLQALVERVAQELSARSLSFMVSASEEKGVVEIGVGVLTDEILSTIEELFGGEPVCVNGTDPSDAPAPGPQPQAGDGWRLLVDRPQAGQVYRTGIASDQASLEALWNRIGLDEPLPQVDFQREVVIWFGAVYGSSCPEIRLDDIIVDDALVYADIVLVDAPALCTADANPRAFVVALDRSKLPHGPFVIQLDADGPPAGAPEERTLVDTDLSQPGAVASPGHVGLDPDLPPPFMIGSGDTIEPDEPWPYRLDARCGIEWLGEINETLWRTTEPMPDAWLNLMAPDGTIEVSVELRVEPETAIDATAGDVTITYHPTSERPPACP